MKKCNNGKYMGSKCPFCNIRIYSKKEFKSSRKDWYELAAILLRNHMCEDLYKKIHIFYPKFYDSLCAYDIKEVYYTIDELGLM